MLTTRGRPDRRSAGRSPRARSIGPRALIRISPMKCSGESWRTSLSVGGSAQTLGREAGVVDEHVDRVAADGRANSAIERSSPVSTAWTCSVTVRSSSAASGVRQPPMTVWPRAAKAFANSSPRPRLAPVMTTVSIGRPPPSAHRAPAVVGVPLDDEVAVHRPELSPGTAASSPSAVVYDDSHSTPIVSPCTARSVFDSRSSRRLVTRPMPSVSSWNCRASAWPIAPRSPFQ